VSATGGLTDCSTLSPCSLTQALNQTQTRKYVVIDSGTYALTATANISYDTWLVGRGTKPIITNPAKGYIIKILTGARVRLANLEISGATASTQQQGTGVACESDGGAVNRTLDLDNMLFTSNAAAGVLDHTCTLTVRRSVFRGNGSGIEQADVSSTIDRSEFSFNTGTGFYTDSGTTQITNSFAFRNGSDGFHVYNYNNQNLISFSTSVDNGGYGLVAEAVGMTEASNNIFARNTMGSVSCVGSAQCSYAGTISPIGTDITALRFVSPNAAPYDYHLMSGSSAIDVAATSTMDHDFDGDARPKGGGRDVGADEAQ